MQQTADVDVNPAIWDLEVTLVFGLSFCYSAAADSADVETDAAADAAVTAAYGSSFCCSAAADSADAVDLTTILCAANS